MLPGAGAAATSRMRGAPSSDVVRAGSSMSPSSGPPREVRRRNPPDGSSRESGFWLSLFRVSRMCLDSRGLASVVWLLRVATTAESSVPAADDGARRTPGGRPQELRRQRGAARDRPRRPQGRGADDHRPERQRQEHAAPVRQPARAPERGPDLLRGRGDHAQGDRSVCDAPANRDRVPAVQPLPAPDRDEQPHPRDAPDPAPAARRRRGARARSCSSASG